MVSYKINRQPIGTPGLWCVRAPRWVWSSADGSRDASKSQTTVLNSFQVYWYVGYMLVFPGVDIHNDISNYTYVSIYGLNYIYIFIEILYIYIYIYIRIYILRWFPRLRDDVWCLWCFCDTCFSSTNSQSSYHQWVSKRETDAGLTLNRLPLFHCHRSKLDCRFPTVLTLWTCVHCPIDDSSKGWLKKKKSLNN